MDVLAIVLLAVVGLATLPFGGPLLILAAMALLDVPDGFQGTATDFLSGGGWLVLLVIALVALGVALYAISRNREAASAPSPNGAARD